MARSFAATLLAFAFVLPGCTAGTVPVDIEEGAFGDPTTIQLGDDPWRARRRMDLDQLDASLTRATGGIAWQIGNNNGFDVFEDTLGVPDFVNSSTEDLSVSLLFTKFLEDAARSTCRRLVSGNTELERAARAEVFTVDVGDDSLDVSTIRPELSRLLLRFHGRRVAPDDEALGPWAGFWNLARLAPESTPARAWEAVCVALVTHPDFFTY